MPDCRLRRGTLTHAPGAQEKRIRSEIEHLEQDTGIKLRLLCQNYPETPGERRAAHILRRRSADRLPVGRPGAPKSRC